MKTILSALIIALFISSVFSQKRNSPIEKGWSSIKVLITNREQVEKILEAIS
jgi:hypothetical protein